LGFARRSICLARRRPFPNWQCVAAANKLSASSDNAKSNPSHNLSSVVRSSHHHLMRKAVLRNCIFLIPRPLNSFGEHKVFHAT
jgi:hypothetical protein